MAEIVQHLGFEATAAIATLGNLQKALSGVNRQLRNMNKETAKSQPNRIGGFAEAAEIAKKAEDAVNKAGQSFKKTGASGKKAGDDITLSWTTMLRVVQTQVILRSIGALTSAFTDSAQAAHDFQIQVAQISALSSGPGSSIDELSSSVANLSTELGRSVAETGTALFETVQNDISETVAGAEDFVRVSSKLATTFGGELNDSVNALTSVLKVYNLEVEDAGAVGDAFAVAIDKGRIKLEDFADSLGTVLPLAKPLSLGYQEASAAIAALTQSGLNAPTAMTQLRNILQKLVVPTKDLSEAFARLGVASGKELIAQTGNLGNALKALRESVNGDDQALASMFGTIRGQLGVFNLLSNDAKIFNDILAAQENNLGKLDAAFAKVEGTEARRADKEWARFNQTLLEVGETTLGIQTNFIDLFNEIVPNGENAFQVVGAVAGVVALLGVNAASTAVGMKALGASLGTLGFAGAAALLIFANIKVWSDVIDKINQLGNAANNTADALISLKEAEENFANSAITAAMAKETAEMESEWEVRGAFAEDYFKYVDTLYEQFVATAYEADQRVTDNLRLALENMAEAYKEMATNVKDQLKEGFGGEVNEDLEDIQDRIKEINKLEKEKNLDERGKNWLELEESIREAEEAVRDYNAAESEDGRKKASSDFEEARKSLEDLQKNAKGTSIGNQAKEKELELLNKMQTTQISADIKKQKALEQYGGTAAKLFEDMQVQAKVLGARLPDLLSKFNADGTQKTEEQTQANLASAELLIKGYNDIQKRVAELPLDDLGVRKRYEELGKAVQENVAEVRLNNEAIAQELAAKLKEANLQIQVSPTGNEKVDQVLSDVDNSFGDTANPADQVKAQIQATQNLITEQAKYNAELQKANASLAANTASLGGQSGLIATAVAKLNTDIGGAVGRNVDALGGVANQVFEGVKQGQDVISQITQLGNQDIANLGAEAVDKLIADATTLKTTIGEVAATGAVTPEGAQVANKALDTVLSAAEQRKKALGLIPIVDPTVVEAANTALTELQTKASTLGLQVPLTGQIQAAETSMNGLNTAAQNTTTTTGGIGTVVSSVVVPAINAAIGRMQALEAAARAAAAAAAAAASGGGGGNAYFGKQVQYRAMGGPATRGHDTSLVAMNPHEMIVNARQSRNFAAELHAINAGQRPQFREQGGNVSISIGDVNVNGHSSSNPAQTGREIAKSLDREMRLKTSRLKRGK